MRKGTQGKFKKVKTIKNIKKSKKKKGATGMTADVSKLKSKGTYFFKIRTYAIVNGRKIDESNFLVNKTKRCSDIFYKVEDIVLKYLNITQKEIQSETLHKYMFPDDYYNILKKIENTLNIIIDYKKIQFKEFNSIYSLVERINQIYRKGEKYNDNRSV